jgi:hypothetical protein
VRPFPRQHRRYPPQDRGQDPQRGDHHPIQHGKNAFASTKVAPQPFFSSERLGQTDSRRVCARTDRLHFLSLPWQFPRRVRIVMPLTEKGVHPRARPRPCTVIGKPRPSGNNQQEIASTLTRLQSKAFASPYIRPSSSARKLHGSFGFLPVFACQTKFQFLAGLRVPNKSLAPDSQYS